MIFDLFNNKLKIRIVRNKCIVIIDNVHYIEDGNHYAKLMLMTLKDYKKIKGIK